MRNIHICRFDSILDLFQRHGRRHHYPTYEEIKDRVLEVGRYSCFEASYNKAAIAFFTRLSHDQEVVCDTTVGYPWIEVKRRVP